MMLPAKDTETAASTSQLRIDMAGWNSGAGLKRPQNLYD